MVQLTFGDLIVLLSTLGAFGGVIYAAGKLSARVDSLEDWRRSMPNELAAIHTAIRGVRSIMKGGV